MDTSETYIQMRLAAILDLGRGTPAKPIRDDCYFTWQGDKVFIDAIGNWYYDDNGKEVQLERQDQLQILSGLGWKEFDKECLKYDAETKEQAGIQVVIEKLDNTI